MKLIDNVADTTKFSSGEIPAGRYIIEMDGATATTAVVSVFRRARGATAANDFPAANNGVAVTLTNSDSAKEILVGSGEVVVQRATNRFDVLGNPLS